MPKLRPRRKLDYRQPAAGEAIPNCRRAGGNRFLILAFVAIVVLATTIYAFPSRGAVAYRFLTDGGILLLWLGSAAGYGRLLSRFVWRNEFDVPPVLRLVTRIALGLGAMSLAILGLGLAGLLNVLVAWLLIGGGVLICVPAVLRADTPQNRARLKEWLLAPTYAHGLWLLTTPFVVAGLVGSMIFPGILWGDEPNGYDVLEYHLQIPREWFEIGRIVPLHHNVFSFFPFNVEMHFLLAMHLRGEPWAGMYLAQLMHGAFIVLTVFAIYGLARWKSNRTAAVLAAVAFATVPWLAQLAPVAYDEGGLLLFGALAIGWAMRASIDPEQRVRRFTLAGLFAGFACGSKLTAVPEVLIGICVVGAAIALWHTLRKTSEPNLCRWRGLMMFALAATLTFSPWLVRNIAWTRNPVFPEDTHLLGHGHFSDVQIERWHRAHTAQPAQQSALARVHALWDQVIADWRYGYLFLPLVIIAIALTYREPETWFLSALLLLITIFWLCFTHLQGRFFILALPIGALVIAQVNLDRWSIPARVATLLLAIALICSQAAIGAARLHSQLWNLLYGKAQMADALGIENAKLTSDALDQIPADAKIILVGDAKAFWYQMPMSRLKYRTVFDADTSGRRGIIEAWAGEHQQRDGAWLVIDPSELARFEKTYQPMTPLPPSVLKHDRVYVVPPREQ